MLDAEEQRFRVRRELAAADFRAHRAAHELLQTAALRTFRRAYPAAVVGAARLRAVGDHPQVAGAIEADVVRRADRTQLVGVRVARVVGAVLAHSSQIGDEASARWIAAQQEYFPGKLAGRVIVARFANLDDVAERIR